MTDRLWNFYSTVSLINALVSNCESKRDMRITPIIFVYIRSMLKSAGQTGVAAYWGMRKYAELQKLFEWSKVDEHFRH